MTGNSLCFQNMATVTQDTCRPLHEDSLHENTASRPSWFRIAMVVGLVIRLWFVFFTEGTYDVRLWTHHAFGVAQKGLMAHYQSDAAMNHPPVISVAAKTVLTASLVTGIPFRILWRLPFVFLDAATTALLLRLLENRRCRFAIVTGYWLNPLAMIFSAYHGNVDTSVALVLTSCLYLLSRQRVAWAGVVMGLGLWIRLPPLLALPAVFFWLPTWRQRTEFALAFGLTALAGYLPACILDPAIVYHRVFAYQGLLIQTSGGVKIWGMGIFLPVIQQLPEPFRTCLLPPAIFLYQHDVQIALAALLLIAWLRRRERTLEGLGTTITAVYTILYGFSDSCSFQYFAWSLPCWFFAGWIFALLGSLLAGGYVYSLYAYLCGNPALAGKWDFIGHAYWPAGIEILRSMSVLFFFGAGVLFLLQATVREVLAWRSPRSGSTARFTLR